MSHAPQTQPRTGNPAGSGAPSGHAGSGTGSGTGVVTVRLWAGARSAAGVAEVEVPVAAGATVGSVRDEVVRRFADRPGLADVLAVCSVLVGDRPVGREDPGAFAVAPGETVEFLPPFAGG